MQLDPPDGRQTQGPQARRQGWYAGHEGNAWCRILALGARLRTDSGDDLSPETKLRHEYA